VGYFRPRLELLEARTLPSMVTWINPAGGDWDTGSNWDANRVPNASDDAVLSLLGITVTHSTAASDSVSSVTSQAAIAISAGTLSIANESAINAPFTLTGGTLAGTGNMTVNGLLSWTGGTMAGAGHTVAGSGLAIGGNATKTLDGRTFDN